MANQWEEAWDSELELASQEIDMVRDADESRTSPSDEESEEETDPVWWWKDLLQKAVACLGNLDFKLF